MPEVVVTLKCVKCGRDFVHKADTEKNNGQAYRIWAKEHVKLCPDCFNKRDKKGEKSGIQSVSGDEYRKAKQDARQEKEERILDGIKLVSLGGTERQIGWGTRLRREALCKVCEQVEPNKGFISLVNSKTDANWWIDNKKQIEDIYSFIMLLIRKED